MRNSFAASTVVAVLLLACCGPAKPTPASPAPTSTQNTLVETPDYTGVIFSKHRASEWGFLFNLDRTEFWEPSEDDVSKAEKCIKQLLVSVQQDPDDYRREHAAFILENLGQYRRQYVGRVVSGEKRIWCNAFYDEGLYPDWMDDPVYVLDGGRYYWEIEYVLPKDECISFHVHGEA